MITNNSNLPEFIYQSVLYWSKHHDSGADYSITQLLNPPRIAELQRLHGDEIVEDATDRIWSLLGSATHKVIESAIEEDTESFISERRFFAELSGISLSGQVDVYDKKTKTVYDLKTTSIWEPIFEKGGVRRERTEQLNSYAWLARQEGLEVERAAAVLIFRDWSPNPPAHVRGQNKEYYPKEHVREHHVNMWSDEDAEAFLRKRIYLREQAKEQLPFCTTEERWNNNVRCQRYCNVMPFCTQYQVIKDS